MFTGHCSGGLGVLGDSGLGAQYLEALRPLSRFLCGKCVPPARWPLKVLWHWPRLDDCILDFGVQALGITHIVSMNGSTPRFPGEFKYFTTSATDDDHSVLLENMWEAIKFIRMALAGGGAVLVHCRHGVNRSGAMVMGYLMMSEGLSYAEVPLDVGLCALARGTEAFESGAGAHGNTPETEVQTGKPTPSLWFTHQQELPSLMGEYNFNVRQGGGATWSFSSWGWGAGDLQRGGAGG